MSQMLNLKAKIFVFISFVFISMFALKPLMAAAVQPLHTVDIAVADESANTRQLAFTQGLNEVFIRISGDSVIMSKLKRPPASRYVQQFSYQPIENPESTEEGEALEHLLNIQYNGKKMEKYLLDNGFSIWSEHRSDVVVWLTIRDGQAEYVLKDSDQSLLKTTMNDALSRRGVPHRWPLNDYKDRKNLNAADIRGGFKEPLTKASKRYGNGPVLAGSMIWNGQQWQSSWSLLMASTEQYWSMVDSDYTQLINTAVNTAADTMGSVFAVNNARADQQLAILQLDVQAVESVARYRRVENYLKNLNAVDTAFPAFIDGQHAVFQITLRSEEKDFLNLINNDAVLVAVAKPAEKSSEVQLQQSPPLAEFQSLLSEDSKTEDVAETVAFELNEGGAETDSPQPDSPQAEPQQPKYYYRLIN